jgi:hypothetical protein
MKPFLTPHANVRRTQPAGRPVQTPAANAMRSTVLLSLLRVPRQGQGPDGPRNR